MDLVTRRLSVAAVGLLIGGAEVWVRGASRLACSLGVWGVELEKWLVRWGRERS